MNTSEKRKLTRKELWVFAAPFLVFTCLALWSFASSVIDKSKEKCTIDVVLHRGEFENPSDGEELGIQRLSTELRRNPKAQTFIMRWYSSNRGSNSDLLSLIYTYDKRKTILRYEQNDKPLYIYSKVREAAIHAVAKDRGGHRELLFQGCRRRSMDAK